jgi:glycosyltransferase involved in cell wall biosynthesis
MNKTRLLVVIPNLKGGGAEKVILNIISGLDRDKFTICLLVIKNEGEYVDLLPDDIKLVDLNCDRVRNSLLKLIKEINIFRPDVVLSTLGHLNLAIISIKIFFRGRPKIVIREANTPSMVLLQVPKFRRFFYRLFYKVLYSNADFIIAQCKEMMTDIITYYGLKKSNIEFIYNPLNLEYINMNKNGDSPYSRENLNFLAVGRLSHQKGFDILIKSFAYVLREYPNAYLTVLGSGILKDQLISLAKEEGVFERISFEGFVTNPYTYYYYADCYVLSSRWEGFPNTLLEALACGCKVVSTNCKSGPFEIIGNNEYGELVEVENVQSLADGMIKSIQGENKTKDRALLFDVNKILNEYSNVLYIN